MEVGAETLHVCLSSAVRAFDFHASDFAPLARSLAGLQVVEHASEASLLQALPKARWVDTWSFEAAWYARAPQLQAVFTPAAGRDWVANDPRGRVPTHFGTFHGPMIAESLLGMMLHWNRAVPEMLENERRAGWDRNLQAESRLLRSQRVLIVGYGNIGRACAVLLRALGMEVVGWRRTPGTRLDPESGARLCSGDQLDAELRQADHVVLLLPGGDATRGFFGPQRLAAMKPSAALYNFGRGTTLREDELLQALDLGQLSRVGLDVTEAEPLPADSALWRRNEVFVMPHSSCVYEEYRALHVAELRTRLGHALARAGAPPGAV